MKRTLLGSLIAAIGTFLAACTFDFTGRVLEGGHYALTLMVSYTL
jgi:hypothetical protein